MPQSAQEIASDVQEITKEDVEELFSDSPLIITDSEVRD